MPDQTDILCFDFRPQNTTEEGKEALEKLMRGRSAGKAEDGLAGHFAKASTDYACIGASVQLQFQDALRGECGRLLGEMVQQRFLEEGHLERILLAFEATCGWSEELHQEPDTSAMRVRKFIQAAVQDALQTMSPETRERCSAESPKCAIRAATSTAPWT